MDPGPGVYVGPVFIALGLIVIVCRSWLAERLPGTRATRRRTDLPPKQRVVVFGASFVFAGMVALLAGLGLLDWWFL